MRVLHDAQAIVIESLLTKMLTNDPDSISQLEAAIEWFQCETNWVSCPFEQVWSKIWRKKLSVPDAARNGQLPDRSQTCDRIGNRTLHNWIRIRKQCYPCDRGCCVI